VDNADNTGEILAIIKATAIEAEDRPVLKLKATEGHWKHGSFKP
jgi:hypothetical protein